MIADGGEAICDIDVLRHQHEVFGPVASDTTVWRALNEIGAVQLRRIALARAKIRARMWQLFGGPPASRAAGRDIGAGVVVLDVDSMIVLAHSDKDGAEGGALVVLFDHEVWAGLGWDEDGAPSEPRRNPAARSSVTSRSRDCPLPVKVVRVDRFEQAGSESMATALLLGLGLGRVPRGGPCQQGPGIRPGDQVSSGGSVFRGRSRSLQAPRPAPAGGGE
jgi:hypothetical protein